jgi:TldD protein
MSDQLQTATELLLSPTGLGDNELIQTLDRVMGAQIDYADLYFQYSKHESWSMDEGTVKSGSYGIDQGVGIRAVSGEKTGFAYSDEILLSALTDAAEAARSIARGGNQTSPVKIQHNDHQIQRLYQPLDPLGSMADNQKVDLLKEVEQVARQIDPRVTQVMVSLAGTQDAILVARSDGHLAADIRPLVRMNVSVIVDQDGRIEQGSSGGGGRYSYQYFVEENRAHAYAEEAVRQALVNLESREAPAGEMTVVLGSGWPGILLHEAIGHGLEGDFNRKGTSAFSGRIGEKVASELCTVVDDGTIENRRGSLSIDDEGEASQNTVLIENGILKGYMQDQMNARLMNTRSTGNGRRESYAHLPMPRMTNTYMHAGEHDPARGV